VSGMRSTSVNPSVGGPAVPISTAERAGRSACGEAHAPDRAPLLPESRVSRLRRPRQGQPALPGLEWGGEAHPHGLLRHLPRPFFRAQGHGTGTCPSAPREGRLDSRTSARGLRDSFNEPARPRRQEHRDALPAFGRRPRRSPPR
jgi:hypothetical protein